MNNKEVAQILSEMAELLELAGENPFKIRAYAQGARIIESQDLEETGPDRGKPGKEGVSATVAPESEEAGQEVINP